MKRIAEDDFHVHAGKFLGRHRLHRAVRADRHEGRRFDRAAREVQAAPARHAVRAEQFEAHAQRRVHGRSSTPAAGVSNVASP